MYDFEEDRREANRILREWITCKTGTTDIERAMWKLGSVCWIIREKLQDSIEHVTDILAQASPNTGYDQHLGVTPSTRNN